MKYRGLIDDPLTEQGYASMNQVWRTLKNDVTLLISSPLSRCAKPSQSWAEEANIPLQIDVRLQELHYGLWEGKTAQEVEVVSPGMLQIWRKNPEHMTPPQGESMFDFQMRTLAFLEALKGLCQDKKHQHVLIIAHSGTIRSLIAHALAAPCVTTRHLSMPYACWSRLVYEDDVMTLDFHARQVV
jgi:alpha-ribazole phosphatase/probable phosphoglycerate mutase